MSTKSFREARKPGRQPTAEEIAAFEETGRAIAREARIAAKAESRAGRKADSGEHGNTETSLHGNEASRKHGEPPSQNDGSVAPRETGITHTQVAVDAETINSVDTETQKPEPMVRLTIDLPESVHTRFKAACAITRRKMVEEVRSFIEKRTGELEGEPRG